MHDIALGHLFSTVTLYFGVTTLLDQLRPDVWLTRGRETDDYEKRLYDESWQLLDRITSDSRFAASVRKVVVIYLSDGPFIFEKNCLEKALRHVGHLKAFHWYGGWPPVADDIVAVLVHTCPELEELRLPRYLLDSEKHVTLLRGLRHLSTFICCADGEDVEDEHFPEEFQTVDPSSRPSLEELMRNNQNTLRKLDIEGWRAVSLPIPTLSQLTHLHLYTLFGEQFSWLGLILHHLTSLRSLSVFSDSPALFTLLQEHSSALSQLQSLRLEAEVAFTQEELLPLIHTIRNSTALRRLDLAFSFHDDPIVTLAGILNRESPISVLGLNLGCAGWNSDVSSMKWTDEQCRRLSDCLPNNLSSLRLISAFERIDCHTEPLLDRFRELLNLHFLYIGNVRRFHPFLAVDLAADIASLATVGVNDRMWDVDKREDGEFCLHHWPDPLIVVRLQEKFVSEDDFWLMNGVRICGLRTYDDIAAGE
ncbi:hypothetical protein GLOTRDRAFT_140506 [Gloeophyllum trabeum ATCC 11539]|uniref:F-box domain-containing protein n=1 Tax=Gloeophyllum trabeum (strain ATCC 11539 / FP-39264 / Madison 617) TaxID=670483 RepID=S7PX29_GLOTA|nr:uncharacterized protein GLOTRDRAFT_140506 [Gloeophyllum trabeum ATCC 11539]EPQ52038.1 hypothetical protein GLOTRDRAFT_140506 [Gloeophyllum trabeum ATCC 11539]